MSKYKYFSIVFLLSLSVNCFAMDVKSMFLSMPDSLSPLVDRQKRETLISSAMPESDTCSAVKNVFGSESWISHIDDNLIVFHPSQVHTIEMRVFCMDNDDSVLCVIDTYLAPEKESRVVMYGYDWSEVYDEDLQEKFSNFVVSDAEDKVLGTYSPLPDIHLVSATFDKNDEDVMIVNMSLPLLNDEEKCKQKAENMQRKLNWNGILFK